MQISKILLLATGALWTLSACGSDNEAQAKAREALEQKFKELQSPSPAVNGHPTNRLHSDSEATAKARAAVRQRLKEDQAHAAMPGSLTASTLPPDAPTPAGGAAPLNSTVLPVPAQVQTELAPTGADSAGTTRFIEGMREKMQALSSQKPLEPAILPPPPVPEPLSPSSQPVTPALSLPVAAAAPAAASAQNEKAAPPEPKQNSKTGPAPKTSNATAPPSHNHAAKVEAQKGPERNIVRTQPAFTQLEGPPSPVSAERQRQLTDLLRQYQSDEISPEEYHARRAKILAEP
jgi:hypothetical protein